MSAQAKTNPESPNPVAETKAGRTREKILIAATELFAAQGYEGASIRDIEHKAGVKRGLVTYHFGNKEDVWKAMANYAFSPYLEDLKSKISLLQALDEDTRFRVLIEGFMRTSAARPYMNQLMIQENFTPTWRTQWMIENYLFPARELNELFSDPIMNRFEKDPNFRYALLGACTLAFSLPCEAETLFDVDTHSEEFIQRHSDLVYRIFKTAATEIPTEE